MEIYVVQPGDSIDSIANQYGVSAMKLIRENELDNPDNLVIGQTIIITYPKVTHAVQEGDTLQNIAEAYGVTQLQLLRNNPFLSDRDFLQPGEIITISYDTIRQITTNGFTYPYIRMETLQKTLPALTYLTIFNYIATDEGTNIAFYDESDIIQTAKEYGVIPLMMTSTLTPTGEPNLETAFEILLNEELQELHISNIIEILKSKGYFGVNMTFQYYSRSTQTLYENFILKASSRIQSEGFLFFATFNINKNNNERFLEQVDYTVISQAVNGIMFIEFIWGINNNPPAPVMSIPELYNYADYALSMVNPDKMSVGIPVLSYDWLLPYVPGRTSANSLTVNAALALAQDTGSVIQFDEVSQTPFFTYNRITVGAPAEHFIWSLDARSINALTDLVVEHELAGTSFWNIMVYYAQLWLVITSQYDIMKFL